MKNTDIRDYYDAIAPEYDDDRFSNSYGAFIDKQERKFLSNYSTTPSNCLSLGCGTGRFMEFASVGLDFSPKMVEIARKKYPKKEFYCSDADTTPFENNTFDQIICFHVLMHLEPGRIDEIFREVNRILKPGGTFIYDYPSKERRKLTRYKAKNWHGGTAFNQTEMDAILTRYNWKTQKKSGVLFFPIHQLPISLRKIAYPMDQLGANSFAKRYSSYLIQLIEKPKS